MLQAETQHVGRAVIEQVIADAKGGALAHLPSASLSANTAWDVLRAIAYNLTGVARGLGLVVSRHGHHRHDPKPAGRRARPTDPRQPTAEAAPTPTVDLADRRQ